MSAVLMPGAPVADAVLAAAKARVTEMKAAGVTPGLGTILVGDDEASAGYVRRKHQTCEQIGIASFHHEIPADADQTTLLAAVDDFNDNPEVDGYIIQHPVPDGFDFNEALARMDPAKDADGLHPTNLGKLVLQEPGPVPCTPAGIQAMLEHYGVEVAGKNVVVVGRGPTLGRPMALLLSNRGKGADAAVTVVHSRVPNLADYTRRADIVIGAVGVPNFIKPDHGEARSRRGERWYHLGGAKAASRCRRVRRRGRRLDHPPPGRGWPDDRRPAVEEHRGCRRAPDELIVPSAQEGPAVRMDRPAAHRPGAALSRPANKPIVMKGPYGIR